MFAVSDTHLRSAVVGTILNNLLFYYVRIVCFVLTIKLFQLNSLLWKLCGVNYFNSTGGFLLHNTNCSRPPLLRMCCRFLVDFCFRRSSFRVNSFSFNDARSRATIPGLPLVAVLQQIHKYPQQILANLHWQWHDLLWICCYVVDYSTTSWHCTTSDVL